MLIREFNEECAVLAGVGSSEQSGCKSALERELLSLLDVAYWSLHAVNGVPLGNEFVIEGYSVPVCFHGGGPPSQTIGIPFNRLARLLAASEETLLGVEEREECVLSLCQIEA